MGDVTAMGNAGSGMGVPGSGFPPQQHHHHPHQISQFLPPMDRCAGCGAVDTPLLACDDLDRASGKKKDIVIDPSQRLRYVAAVVTFLGFMLSRSFFTMTGPDLGIMDAMVLSNNDFHPGYSDECNCCHPVFMHHFGADHKSYVATSKSFNNR